MKISVTIKIRQKSDIIILLNYKKDIVTTFFNLSTYRFKDCTNYLKMHPVHSASHYALC